MALDNRQVKRLALASAAALGILAIAPDLNDPRAYMQTAIAFIGTYWQGDRRQRRRIGGKNGQGETTTRD